MGVRRNSPNLSKYLTISFVLGCLAEQAVGLAAPGIVEADAGESLPGLEPNTPSRLKAVSLPVGTKTAVPVAEFAGSVSKNGDAVLLALESGHRDETSWRKGAMAWLSGVAAQFGRVGLGGKQVFRLAASSRLAGSLAWGRGRLSSATERAHKRKRSRVSRNGDCEVWSRGRGILHVRQVLCFGYCFWILFAFFEQISADS
jgi:hypothetical protein